MIDTIILDLDGPLLDGIDRHYACYSSILRQHGFQPIPKEQYWAGKRRRKNRQELLSQSDATKLYDDFRSQWLSLIETKAMLALDRLQPDVLQILSDWKAAGIQLVLASMRNNRDTTILQLRELGLLPFFDQVFLTGSNDTAGKAAAVRTWIEDTSVSVAEAIWVGDTEVDVHAARQLQIPVYTVTCGLRTEQQLLAEKPDCILSDLRAVSGEIRRVRKFSA